MLHTRAGEGERKRGKRGNKAEVREIFVRSSKNRGTIWFPLCLFPLLFSLDSTMNSLIVSSFSSFPLCLSSPPPDHVFGRIRSKSFKTQGLRSSLNPCIYMYSMHALTYVTHTHIYINICNAYTHIYIYIYINICIIYICICIHACIYTYTYAYIYV